MAYYSDVHETAHTWDVYATLTERFGAWRRHRRTLRELRKLSARERDELGIGTSDFEAIAHGQKIPDRRS